MFWVGLSIGLVCGVIFHVGLRKFFDNAKAKAKKVADSLQD